MNMYEFFFDPPSDRIVTCPNCGGEHYESNRFDAAEALCREATREVPFLLFEGRRDEAREVLIAFYVLRIENILRPQHLCLCCGVSFDA
ncbi:hypothetical protein [Novosphingobium sp.]|uniref:hypothetical protein n=1 Tax=Novosphingobium sp. TaxID=1874826 RepID=UPI0038B81FF9